MGEWELLNRLRGAGGPTVNLSSCLCASCASNSLTRASAANLPSCSWSKCCAVRCGCWAMSGLFLAELEARLPENPASGRFQWVVDGPVVAQNLWWIWGDS